MSRKPLVPHWSLWIIHLAWILGVASISWFLCLAWPRDRFPDGRLNWDAGDRMFGFALVYLLAAPLTLVDAIAGGVVWNRCHRRGQPAHLLWKILTLAAVAVLLALIINLVV